ncbi:MAG TPA: acyltransferase domain-containing protein, partial [Solirubrobacteraceae bacterium]|nr:acyltransferase domain-containing protein [Solirubrobacteraceae bacterium]
LSQLFGEYGTGTQWCAIGSVKSMIGHTKATAGVAGLVKAALALHHRVLPPTIGVTRPNPKADFPASPFYVNTEARPWIRGVGDHPRRAGVSAFGFGGTDFHIVLEEYTGSYVPEHAGALDRWPAELLVWRGTRERIVAALDALGARLDAGAEPAVADLARTAALEAGAPRAGEGTLAVVAESLEDLRAKLPAAREALAGDAARVHLPHGIHWSERPLAADGRVAFLFPGQGSQAVDMARDVALAFPEARECFERADRVLADHYDQPLSRFVLPPPSFSDEERRRRQAELTDTHVAQPALGVAGLAYLAVLRSLGVEPEMAAGHSYGEFVALAAAGGLGEDDLLRLSEARGRFMAEAAGGEPGAMAAVDAAPEALRELVDAGDVVAANLNAPEQTVLSGAGPAIEAALEWCAQRGIRARALPVACAFHSPLVAPAQRKLAELLGRTPIAPVRIPVFSNTTAEAHAEAPEAIAEVLGEHLARPVRFVDEIEAMHRDGARVFVEAGPRAVLSGLVERILGEREHLAVPVDRNGRPGLVQLLHCLAALAAEGVPVRLERLFEGRSAERLDPSELRSPNGSGALPPSAWLVDGGRARPAVPPASGPTHAEEQPHVTTSSNGAAAAPAAPQPPSRTEQRPPATPGDGPAVPRAPAAPLPTPAAPPPARVAPVG